MTYSATCFRLLISAPGDVRAEDIAAVIDAVVRWNAVYGREFSAVVVPTHWRHHSAAEHGARPQESLNLQLVEDVDIVIALFWQRLGSPTGEAESGTLEEITVAQQAGAYVAVLRCDYPLPRDVDASQLERLNKFLDEEIRDESLVLPYGDQAELARHVETIIVRAVTRVATRAQASAEAVPSPAMIWPRIDSDSVVKTDSKGRVKTQRQLSLVLSNTGDEPATDVRFRLEPEQEGDVLPMLLEDERALEVLAPQGEASYRIYPHSGVASQARCVVTWNDSHGEHENAASVRFF